MFVVIQDSKRNKGRREEKRRLKWCMILRNSVGLERNGIDLLEKYKIKLFNFILKLNCLL